MVRADLHNHLGRNGDNPGFDETIDIAHPRLGNGGIFGIANSDDYRYEAFVQQKGGKYNRVNRINDKGYRVAVYVPEKDILVVKCQEMFTDKADVLAIAMPHNLNISTKKSKSAIMLADDYGAVLDAVHPSYIDGIGEFLKENLEYLQYFSTWEVFNGSAELWIPGVTPRFANEKSFAYYFTEELDDKFDMGMSASTDGHSVRAIGTCYTTLDDYLMSNPNVPEALENALRNAKSWNNLHMEPNRADALKHGLDMAVDKVKKKLRK